MSGGRLGWTSLHLPLGEWGLTRYLFQALEEKADVDHPRNERFGTLIRPPCLPAFIRPRSISH